MVSFDPRISLLSPEWDQYELIDSGKGRRLERIGEMVVDRPEPKAWWERSEPERCWKSAAVSFQPDQGWVGPRVNSGSWELCFGSARFLARLSNNKHLGVFPEQSALWGWLSTQLSSSPVPRPRVLNLFGYTGIASLVAAHVGADVTHVDGSKPAVSQGRENTLLPGNSNLSIRWIIDDVRKFVSRELRRGSKYEAILLDPPAFGRGPRQEVWKSNEQLPELLAQCARLLSDQAVLLAATVYSIDASAIMVGNLLVDAFSGRDGWVDVGEVVVKPKRGLKPLSLALVGRWTASPL